MTFDRVDLGDPSGDSSCCPDLATGFEHRLRALEERPSLFWKVRTQRHLAGAVEKNGSGGWIVGELRSLLEVPLCLGSSRE